MKRKGSKPKPIIQPAVKSLKKARKITSEFHNVTRQLQAAVAEGRAEEAAAAEAELSALGGRASYQAASELTTSRHRTCKWVFSLLTQMELRPGKGQPPLKVLEVGAVNAQLLSVPWLSVRAIDLRPCLPSIEQADFLTMKPSAGFDIVVCAMVLNCVPTAVDRGTMLLKMRAHLKRSGHAFIVIPLRCLNDSFFMTAAYFDQALAAAGFEVKHTRVSPKLAFYCLGTTHVLPSAALTFADPPKVVARGHKTNDFAVSYEEAQVNAVA